MEYTNRINTFCLTDEQNEFVESCLPGKNYELVAYEVATDIIAHGSSMVIINANDLDSPSAEMLFDYYSQIDGCGDESVIWLGEPKPSKKLQKYLKCYNSFEDIKGNLKYLLLTSFRKTKKAVDYSKKLTYGIKILSLIRKYPGISTRELTTRTELPVRSVQRYIAALRATGEWIQYNYTKKGWELFQGISILFNDLDHKNE